jgi:hypothetical protein
MFDPHTAPPQPAPYLADVPSLPPPLVAAIGGQRPRPSAAQIAESRRIVSLLRKLIRDARTRYEQEHGVVIVPEPPAGLDPHFVEP